MSHSGRKRTRRDWCQHVSVSMTSAHDPKSSSQTRESSGAFPATANELPPLSPLSQYRKGGGVERKGGQSGAEEKKAVFSPREGRRTHQCVGSDRSFFSLPFFKIWFVFKFGCLVAAEAIWSELYLDLWLSLQPNAASSVGKRAAAECANTLELMLSSGREPFKATLSIC